MSIRWTVHLRSEPASVPLARRLLLGTMDAAGIDPDISHDVGVALTEACANAVEHGMRSGGAAQGFRVDAVIDGDVCHVEVLDAGPGFPAPPSTAPAVCAGLDALSGRGLFLMEALVDHVCFTTCPPADGAHGGALVSFDKTLKWRGADGSALLRAG